MSALVDTLRAEFQDEEYRHSYAEECLNTMIAAQIKVLREQRGMTQAALAKSAGMLQPRLSVMESADYSNWSINTLKRLARAFDLALSVRFDAFSGVVLDFEEMSKEALSRPSFKDDPVFMSAKVKTHRSFRRRRRSESDIKTAQGLQTEIKFLGEVVEMGAPTSKNNSAYSPNQRREALNADCVGIAG
jgi:transcriptional regulator with XRE-family HTH domain